MRDDAPDADFTPNPDRDSRSHFSEQRPVSGWATAVHQLALGLTASPSPADRLTSRDCRKGIYRVLSEGEEEAKKGVCL
jgi:hypothetical protein